MNSKAYNDTIRNLNGANHMYFEMISGVLGTIIKTGSKLTQETIDDMKDAFMDYFYDGIEPEDWNSNQWDWWDKMNPDYFEIKELARKVTDNDSPHKIQYYNKDLRLKKDFKKDLR